MMIIQLDISFLTERGIKLGFNENEVTIESKDSAQSIQTLLYVMFSIH
ncbi:hypothetical protein IFVP177_C1110091 [Vibrio parahaemolyticus]